MLLKKAVLRPEWKINRGKAFGFSQINKQII